MKIAIVAFRFSPDESIGSVRPENWATWLSKEHEVIVITREDTRNQASQVRPYKVLRPRSRLIKIVDSLRGWWGGRTIDKVKHKESSEKELYKRRAVSRGIFRYRMPCVNDLWFFACYKALRQVRPKLIIATHSPYISLIIALFYKIFNPSTKIWLDFRDLWSDNYAMSGLLPFTIIEKKLEKHAIKRASIVSTVSNGLLDSLPLEGAACRKLVVYNAPPVNSLLESELAIREKRTTSGIRVCYTGTIYTCWQDPTPLLKLLAILHKENGLTQEDIIIEVASRDPGNLLTLAQKTNTLPFLRFCGAVSREKSIQMQNSADVLLLLEFDRPGTKGVLTGKVFEYLATDKPILLIGSNPSSELYKLVDRHQRLITLDSLAAVLRGHQRLPDCKPINYSETARQQVLDALLRITT